MITHLLPAKEPFTKNRNPNGYGLVGLISYDTKTDKIMCHECGKWYTFLGSHLKAHNRMTDDDYRVKNGLTFNYPLCSRGYSAAKAQAITPQFIKEGLKMRKRIAKCRVSGSTRKLISHPNNPKRQIGTATESQRNKHGTCDLQISTRYNALVLRLGGRHPKSPEFRREDRALLEVICRRYGRLTVWREEYGIQK